ncbi:Tellurite resistance protein tehB [Mycetohabitans rhizoxinica HKI 454]|uniref:Tellurite resistance protein tehB n=1 Tax=Mycetohabitans rhizoxinica (strain DSM 19002 / CIP 109453 / HKI 454) TaxID=882378 RepID=E5AS78_MYCRK|nr:MULTISPECIES: class I SAM-dependent methyltransferase [Mycetohabitans]MCG1047435.1 class I SAM-dependent methyltransferase [Mycetohabitans sp. B6]CBW75460.1 Tellurite resistance protein tehB [Mycetohabitans rhizoxinica HKI 454]
MAIAVASEWVRRWTHLVPRDGTVLDVACGRGRHVRWFAQRGHPVVALDRDAQALAALAEWPTVRIVHADLEPDEDSAAWPFEAHQRFAAVVVTQYLHRPLFDDLTDALASGGVLLYETFAQGHETLGRPSNPRFLLRAGELLEVARHAALRVVAFEDGFIAGPKPAFVQRLCAVRESRGDVRSRKTGAHDGPARYDLPDQSATISV